MPAPSGPPRFLMTINPNKTILDVKNLTVKFGGFAALKNVSFSVKEGEVLAIIGPNGAGKTVLFRTILGLVPYEGAIKWAPGVKIGYAPQQIYADQRIPITVKEFFALKSGRKTSIFHELKAVGLKPDILNKQIGTLSRGMFQRILIAWALLDHPEVLLFDEPTAGIDVSGEDTIYNLLHRLQKERHLTLLLISHDLHIVFKYTDNVLCLAKEKMFLGKPHQTLTEKTLAELYGESAFHVHD
jgi:zinc transport system ATP-binding protein